MSVAIFIAAVVEVQRVYYICSTQALVVRCTNIVRYRYSPYSRHELCCVIFIIICKKEQQEENQLKVTTKTTKRRRRKKKRKKEVRHNYKLILVFPEAERSVYFSSMNITVPCRYQKLIYCSASYFRHLLWNLLDFTVQWLITVQWFTNLREFEMGGKKGRDLF